MPHHIAAVRGATSIPSNRADAIVRSTAELLRALLAANRLAPADIVSAIFTATPDLDAEFPARAARVLGWHDVPLLGATEMAVSHAPPRIVRVLLTVRMASSRRRLEPVYLGGAAVLRPDLAADAEGARGRRGRARASRPPEDEVLRSGLERRIAIVGLGQIGGSLGLALGRAPDWHRVGWDRSGHTLQSALERGAIDEPAPSAREACARADVVVLAVPMGSLPEWIDRASRTMPRGALLLDTGSARRALVPAMRRAAARGVVVVGAHPLAGNEGRGFDSARADLFDGVTLALQPLAGGVPALARRLTRALGARVLVVDAARHDRALARTSHLPYVVACALERVGRRAHDLGLSGPGFRGMTRLAASNPVVARSYVAANLDRVRAAWRALERGVESEMASIARGVQCPPLERGARRARSGSPPLARRPLA